MKEPRRQRRLIAGAIVLLALSMEGAAADPDAEQLLKSSDVARGGGREGLVWEVEAKNFGTGAKDQQDQRLRIKAVDRSSMAEILDPPSDRGMKILQVDRNMWLTKPGLKKPVSISPRQRLTGQAAIGDIAATNYARDYSAKYLREELVDDVPCHVLELTATSHQTTYDRITYWISASNNVAIQADFLSRSGKSLKLAKFEYGNTVLVHGTTSPFVSRMSITDALTDERTVLEYSHVKPQPLSSLEFDVDNLQ